MSGRCKACNAVMSEEDMVRKFPKDEEGNREYSNLCGACHEEAIMIMLGNYREQEDDYSLYTSYPMSGMREDWT